MPLDSQYGYFHESDTGALLGIFACVGTLFLVVFLYIRSKKLKGWRHKNVAKNCNHVEPTWTHDETNIPNSSPLLQKTVETDGTQRSSIEVCESSSESEPSSKKMLHHYNQSQHRPQPCNCNGLYYSSPGINGIITKSPSAPSNTNGPISITSTNFYPTARMDPISLVEKGRIGISSNSSCCSSTTSSVADKSSSLTNCIQNAHTDYDLVHHRIDLRETKIDSNDVDMDISEHPVSDNNLTTVTTNAVHHNGGDCIFRSNSRDCIVVMNTDGLDDRNGDALYESVSKCDLDHIDTIEPYYLHQQMGSRYGQLEIALLYDAPMRKMTVHVLQARDIPSRDRGQSTHTQVRLILLPSKKQKHKTKIRSGENPQYMEGFVLHRVNPEDVNSMGVRLRLYGCERMRRERLIGEAVVGFTHINLELENNFWLNLEPRSNTKLSSCTMGELTSLARSDSICSSQSMQHGGVPELLLGLCYNATTGRLSVEIVKGSHFRNITTNRAPDTYVKLTLVSSTGHEMGQCKTTIRRGQPNPLYKETFAFQVALFQLADVTLMIAVYNRRGVTRRKGVVGWFSLGLNSSGAEELAHWMDMKESQRQQLCRWHVLVQS